MIINFDGGGFDSSSGSMILANSFGFTGEYSGTSCSLATVPVAAENGKMQRDYWYDVRRKFKELDSPEKIGVMAAKRTLESWGPGPCPRKTSP